MFAVVIAKRSQVFPHTVHKQYAHYCICCLYERTQACSFILSEHLQSA